MFEKWITGLRDEHFVARIAEQLEQQRIGFARAGGERNVPGIDGQSSTREIR